MNGARLQRERAVRTAPTTKRLLLVATLLMLLPATLRSQTFEPNKSGFVLKRGAEYIAFDKGRWSAGIEGGQRLEWSMFLWHDRWVYETLPGGKVESGPTLQDDGRLTLRGVFSAREQSAPMKFACDMTATVEGVHVRCELEKSGPLPLTNGIWLQLAADRRQFSGTERVWVDPTWHGTVAAPAAGNAAQLLIELKNGRSLCLGRLGYRAVEREASPGSYAYRINLVPGDFEVGKKAVVEYTVGFADMPATFPGQISSVHKPLKIGQVTPSHDRVKLFGKLELLVHVDADYENPFDPDEVRLDATFHSPSGKEQTVPGFFAVDYRREIHAGSEVLLPQSQGDWKVRFSPQETGRYTWRLSLRDRTGQVAGGDGTFTATSAAGPGFVRVSRVDPHYFAFDNGQGYFPIGHNLPIYHTSGQLGDEAMRKFAGAQENFNRWWMSASGLGIEWMERLGWYRQDTAARLDAVLDQAQQLRLYYMLCMDTHQDFREQGWELNPFHAKNGGPCQTPADWFSNEQARKYYRNRLRYTVARWGYSPHVLCWEFGNEFEGWAASPQESQLAWHREMSQLLRSIDPFGHLITTSFWSNTGPEEFWRLRDIDIVQTHCYTNDDGNVAETVRRYGLHQWQKFNKPHIFGEFGIRSHSTTAEKDPQGWAIHNALWAGLFSFCAGGPMPWWHEDYLDKLDLYFHFTALHNFTQDLPLGTARWEPLSTTAPQFVDRSRAPETRDVVLLPSHRWGKAEHDEFVVQRDGTIADGRIPQLLLHGGGHPDLKHPPTFVVEYPQPGEFRVHIGKVSNSGLLRIWMDDELQLEKELPCGEQTGKASVWVPQWKLWETTYDQELSIKVPAGRHRIRVDNFGKDWVEATRFTFAGCQVLDHPNVLVCGMQADTVAILWVQNKDSCWFNHGRPGQVHPVDAFTLGVQRLADGKVSVDWWETWRGGRQSHEDGEIRGGQLLLKFPTLQTDVAVKVRASR